VDGEAFMAGLLHDIGVLVLAKAQAAAMARFEPGAGDDDEAAALEEERHFGITHEATAALLLRIWGLPAWLGAALAAHHRPPPALAWAAGEQGLPALLRLADHVAERAGFGLWPRCAAQPAACPPGLGDDDLDAIAAALSDDVAHLSAT
jgi:HD-like signal output (HDOD) protein